jgi:hypothetical protein
MVDLLQVDRLRSLSLLHVVFLEDLLLHPVLLLPLNVSRQSVERIIGGLHFGVEPDGQRCWLDNQSGERTLEQATFRDIRTLDRGAQSLCRSARSEPADRSLKVTIWSPR